MNPILTDHDMDEIFAWLQEYVKEDDLRADSIKATSIKPEHRELAWQAAQAHQRALETLAIPDNSNQAVKKDQSILKQAQDWLIDFIARDPIKIAFASDGRHNEGGFGPYDHLLGGDCSLTVEYIPDDPDWKIIKVKFSEHRIAEFQGRRIAVGIAGKRYDLSEVNRRGIAEGEIPGDLDLAQLDYVYYGKPLDSES